MRGAWLAVAFLLAPLSALAQTTGDGIDAIARGDYAGAIRILTPLTEAGPAGDPVAQFFLAAAYQENQSPPAQLRACGIYLRSAAAVHPLAIQAAALARALDRGNPFFRRLCEVGNEYGWQLPPPMTFSLGPNHSVRIDGERLIVGRNDVEKPSSVFLGGPGFHYFPVRHTEVHRDAGDSASRHFLEFLLWTPGPELLGWSLRWWVYEIVGVDAVLVDAAGDMPVKLAAVPELDPALTQLVGIREGAAGDAQWFIGGPQGTSGTIPRRD